MKRTSRWLMVVALTALATTACAPSGISSTAAATAPAAGTVGHETAHADHGEGHAHQGTTHGHAECSAHEGDLSRQGEHCLALALTDPAGATAVAVTNGDWTDPATWGGSTPGAGATVHIPEGTTVTVDGIVTSPIEWLRLDGTLAFATRVDTELRLDTLVESPSGLFQMGTALDPIAAGVTARILVIDDGPIDRTIDPIAIGRGLILHGRTVIAGAEKTPFVELARPARAGDTTVELTTAPVGWAAGDELVIAGTSSDATGDETVKISAVQGTTVSFGTPLAYDHVGPEADLNVHVANLTRNAVIESEASDVAHRGHVMFMHTTDVELSNAGFYRLGRTDKNVELYDRIVDQGTASVCVATDPQPNVRGRYSVHFHRAGVVDMPAATVRGTVATDNPGWAYVNHSSHVDFVGNVAYDIDGASFNTEAGDEIGSFLGNLSVRTHGTAGHPTERQSSQDFGHEGYGFWFQGSGIVVEDNVAAGSTGAGFIFYTESLLEPHAGRVFFPAQNLSFDAGGLDLVPIGQVPILDFRRNEAYGSEIGARSYYHRTDITIEFDEIAKIANAPLGFPESRVEDLTLWSTNTGWMSNYTIDTVFSNLRIVGADGEGVGFDASNVYNRGVHKYVDFDVSGHEIGVIASLAGDVTIDGGRFDNREHNLLVNPPRQVERRVLVTGDPSFGGSAPEVSAVADLRVIVDGDDLWYLLDDRIILDYGRFSGEQLFYVEQAADTVLFDRQPSQATPDDPGAEIEDRIIGLTNAEIRSLTGSSLGGAFATDDAAATNGVVGLVGTPAPDPGPLQTAEEQMRQEFEFDEEGQGIQSQGTIVAPDCEEVVAQFERDDELIAECQALLEGDGDTDDPELAAECAELEAEPIEDDEGEEELTEEQIRQDITEYLAEIDSQEIEEIRAECTEFLASDETQEDPVFVLECQIFLELTGS